MVFKLNISNKGKSWKMELESDTLSGKSLGEKIEGELISPDLSGYELEIAGGTDEAGFPMMKEVEGSGLTKRLLTKGWGFTTRSKEGKLPKGIRKRKTVRGKVISEAITQINLNVIKEGSKKLEDIFPEQNKPKEKPTDAQPEQKQETSPEQSKE
jgi:small subunit ribosomal protein S6e